MDRADIIAAPQTVADLIRNLRSKITLVLDSLVDHRSFYKISGDDFYGIG